MQEEQKLDEPIKSEEDIKKQAANAKKKANSVSTLCARRMLQGVVELRIMMGDILEEEADAVVFPLDKDLTFKQPSVEKMFKYQMSHLFKMYVDAPNKRALRYDNLKLQNASKVYFCKVPTWMGGAKEREEYHSIIHELFDMILKDGVMTLSMYPLNKKMGSFPLSLMARQTVYYLDWWVVKYMNEKGFKVSSIKIICGNHPTARAFCAEMSDMNEDLVIGGFNMKGMRRLSEDLVDTLDPVEQETQKKTAEDEKDKKFFSSSKKK